MGVNVVVVRVNPVLGKMRQVKSIRKIMPYYLVQLFIKYLEHDFGSAHLFWILAGT